MKENQPELTIEDKISLFLLELDLKQSREIVEKLGKNFKNYKWHQDKLKYWGKIYSEVKKSNNLK